MIFWMLQKCVQKPDLENYPICQIWMNFLIIDENVELNDTIHVFLTCLHYKSQVVLPLKIGWMGYMPLITLKYEIYAQRFRTHTICYIALDCVPVPQNGDRYTVIGTIDKRGRGA